MKISICCSRRSNAERQLSRANPRRGRSRSCFTGRGALRDSFEAHAAQLQVILVRTIWLEPPIIRRSSAWPISALPASIIVGTHLPMKLADLRGAGVPAAVYDYAPVVAEVMTTGWKASRSAIPAISPRCS
jgi:hypothetical protein